MYRCNTVVKWLFTFLLAIIVSVAIIDFYRGNEWFFSENYCSSKDWHDYALQKSDAERTGPGEQGAAYRPDVESLLNDTVDKLYRESGYNSFVSDLIPLYRSVRDTRPEACKAKQYCSRLPTVSVVIPYHNERLSVVLRSVYSILVRTPSSLLTEVILVDDASAFALTNSLIEHIKKRGIEKVHVVMGGAGGKREGLIRAKVKGAKAAKGEVLVFMDSHSEVGYNWLPPLLEPIARDYRVVTCPFIDVIDCDTFEIRSQGDGARGIFDWKFRYKNVPAINATPGEPFENPVMAGGYFAIDRLWFKELGLYDDQLMIWGGEQYELSFKVWQCHGRVLDVPCSHIGHIYRCKYVPFGDPGIGDFLARNYKRVAEVWMDEYKEHLYRRNKNIAHADAGDLTAQLEVRERLKCRSFKWFMENVMPDQAKHYPAVEPASKFQGLLYSPSTDLCVSSADKKGTNVELTICPNASPLQLDYHSAIRHLEGETCFDLTADMHDASVQWYGCHGQQGNQQWSYVADKQWIYHGNWNRCLAASLTLGVVVRACSDGDADQKWLWKAVQAQ